MTFHAMCESPVCRKATGIDFYIARNDAQTDYFGRRSPDSGANVCILCFAPPGALTGRYSEMYEVQARVSARDPPSAARG